MPIYACSTISGAEKADDLAEVAFCARKSKGEYEPHGEFNALTSRPLDDPTFTLIGHSAPGWNPFKSKPEKIGKLSPKDIATKLAQAYGKSKDKLTTLNLVSCEAGVEFNGTTLAQQVADELGKAGFNNVKVIAPSPPPEYKAKGDQVHQLVTLTSSSRKGEKTTSKMSIDVRVFSSSKELKKYQEIIKTKTFEEIEELDKQDKLPGKVVERSSTPTSFLMKLKYNDKWPKYIPSKSPQAARAPMTLEIDHTGGIEPPSERTSTISDKALLQLKTELKNALQNIEKKGRWRSKKPASLHQQIDNAANLNEIKSIIAKNPIAQGQIEQFENRMAVKQDLLKRVEALDKLMAITPLFLPENGEFPQARRDLKVMVDSRIPNAMSQEAIDALASQLGSAERMVHSNAIQTLSKAYAELIDIDKQIESGKHPSVKPNSSNHLRLKKKMRNIKAEVSKQPIKTLNQALTTKTMEKYLKKNWNRGNDPFSYFLSKTTNHHNFNTLKSHIQNAKDESRQEAESDKPSLPGPSKI